MVLVLVKWVLGGSKNIALDVIPVTHHYGKAFGIIPYFGYILSFLMNEKFEAGGQVRRVKNSHEVMYHRI